MAQYCRYCSKLQVGGGKIFCKAKRKRIREHLAKTTNYCPFYDLTYIDAFGENVKGYQPRHRKIPESQIDGQMELMDFFKEAGNGEEKSGD